MMNDVCLPLKLDLHCLTVHLVHFERFIVCVSDMYLDCSCMQYLKQLYIYVTCCRLHISMKCCQHLNVLPINHTQPE